MCAMYIASHRSHSLPLYKHLRKSHWPQANATIKLILRQYPPPHCSDNKPLKNSDPAPGVCRTNILTSTIFQSRVGQLFTSRTCFIIIIPEKNLMTFAGSEQHISPLCLCRNLMRSLSNICINIYVNHRKTSQNTNWIKLHKTKRV